MDIRKYLSLLIFFIFGHTCNSQIDSFDISSYLYPEVERTTFKISPDINYTNNKFPGTRGLFSSEESNLNTELFLSRTNVSNSRQRQIFNSIRGRGRYLSSSNSNEILDVFVIAEATNRYFIDTLKFIEVEGFTGFSHTDLFSASGNPFSSITSELNPSIGWGRIENISDSWHALVILEELNKNGFIIRDLNQTEILEFAKEISRLKNFRNKDFRLEDLYEFESLANFLIDNNIGSKTEAGFYAVLKDAYDYEGFAIREHGNSFKIGPDIRYRIGNIQRGYKTSSLSLGITYERKRAENKVIQFDQLVSLNVGKLKVTIPGERLSSFTGIEQLTTFLESTVGLKLGIFLNQRTNLQVGINTIYNYYKLFDVYDFNTNLSIGGRYYVSPVLRYSLTSSFNFFSNRNNQFSLPSTPAEPFNSFINFGLDYFIR